MNMDNVTFVRDIFGNEEAGIQIQRTPEFIDTAQAVSDFVASLRLPADQNNRMVELLVALVQSAGLWMASDTASCLAGATGKQEMRDNDQGPSLKF